MAAMGQLQGAGGVGGDISLSTSPRAATFPYPTSLLPAPFHPPLLGPRGQHFLSWSTPAPSLQSGFFLEPGKFWDRKPGLQGRWGAFRPGGLAGSWSSEAHLCPPREEHIFLTVLIRGQRAPHLTVIHSHLRQKGLLLSCPLDSALRVLTPM